MSIKFTILGCGSSLGVPSSDGNWGRCNPKEKKNYRTRCSAMISDKNFTILFLLYYIMISFYFSQLHKMNSCYLLFYIYVHILKFDTVCRVFVSHLPPYIPDLAPS